LRKTSRVTPDTAAKEGRQLSVEVEINVTAETLTHLPSRFGCAVCATRRKTGRLSETSWRDWRSDGGLHLIVKVVSEPFGPNGEMVTSLEPMAIPDGGSVHPVTGFCVCCALPKAH